MTTPPSPSTGTFFGNSFRISVGGAFELEQFARRDPELSSGGSVAHRDLHSAEGAEQSDAFSRLGVAIGAHPAQTPATDVHPGVAAFGVPVDAGDQVSEVIDDLDARRRGRKHHG